ncbi:tetratricopeptide repeat protein [Umezakia ovalisporum]|uniref:Tetratricopeptide repeat protein n=2 Tax=Umezakia ovalisporum TaxID=75695 RepID=A0AA43H0E3_9CYAN|nr:tetratricopeptide repeat protein [Umezakia ovalisporum]MDH6058023.1 tetratricopeptide repeat protein [Umezakia ovalisporum FSS-43]MDH6065164.1 tetratricopeptide repeat protein [Umezakia ovalisporum FSS-62]MDH6066943.1 tetratricopeptide repeat protein [Umezakia ovalisporum APH033B]MDH6072046.1 tetratricopeptide repeat protein [Umezakia ovalisporum CobakiLakeA]MDH6074163.1 tetratricopeptide repeat protein [Umezakia ovalisporum CS-1034]
MKLSLCMIVKNEAATLPKCLSSVQGLVDEIIILDTGSKDGTPDVAQLFGGRVYYFQWCNDFSAARNATLKYVTGDWILVLDADETITPNIVPQIKSAIQNEEYLLINLLRQEVGAAQSPYSLVSRLFRNHTQIHFQRPYHALVDDSVATILTQEPHWQIGYLQGVAILHQGYQKTAIAKSDKYAKAQTTMEGFLATHPNDSYVCSKLGALYVQTGKLTQGLELLERGFNQANSQHQGIIPEENYETLYELHYHLGIAYNHLQDSQKAIYHYQAAVKQPIYPMLKLGAYNNLGNLLKASGDINGAKVAYETSLKIDPTFVMGHYNLGMIFKTLGLFTNALACYQKAIKLNPNYAQAYQNLGVVQLKVGNVQGSLTAFKNAILLYEQQNPEEAHRLRQGLRDMGLMKW